MNSEKVKRFIILYLALGMPAMLMLFAAFYGVGILVFLFLIAWIGAGLLLVYLPSTQDRNAS
jgi:Flp pilus assembly protein TadB